MVARSITGRWMRDSYVGIAHGARRGLQRGKVLDKLDARVTPGRFSVATHARSLLAVYDAADLAELDLPWWTYPAVRAVDEHLAALEGRARVFEYGAGASTLWLRARAAEVISVEHDVAFLPTVDALLAGAPGAGTVLSRPLDGAEPSPSDAYVRSIGEVAGDFDLIVVDGRERVRCVRAALPRLAPGGVLLLDDSQRRRYRSVVQDPDLDVVEYRGLVPSLPLPRRTALVRRAG
jgi:predicted O-methyltransferase YrrM